MPQTGFAGGSEIDSTIAAVRLRGNCSRERTICDELTRAGVSAPTDDISAQSPESLPRFEQVIGTSEPSQQTSDWSQLCWTVFRGD